MTHNLRNEELADMHMVYGAAHGNAREAVRLYQERFPNRYLPGHEMFTAIHRMAAYIMEVFEYTEEPMAGPGRCKML